MKQRVVIIGAGAAGGVAAACLSGLPHAQLVAASTQSKVNGEAFASRWNCRCYGEFEEMLDRETPDAVIVCTPSGAHLEACEAAARRGLPVLCEKPLEITLARIAQILDLEARYGVLIGGLLPMRFGSAAQAVHKAAVQGRFGSLSASSVIVPWWREDAYYGKDRWQGTQAMDGGGALMNQSVHAVDLLLWLVNAASGGGGTGSNPVSEVFAFTGRCAHAIDSMEVEDTAVVALRFRNGALGQILGATSMYPGSLRRLVIAGRDGSAELVEDELVRFSFREEHPGDEATRLQFGRQTAHRGGAGNPMDLDHTIYQRNLADFLEALRDGRPPLVTARGASEAVRVVLAAYDSARTGCVARLQDPLPGIKRELSLTGDAQSPGA